MAKFVNGGTSSVGPNLLLALNASLMKTVLFFVNQVQTQYRIPPGARLPCTEEAGVAAAVCGADCAGAGAGVAEEVLEIPTVQPVRTSFGPACSLNWAASRSWAAWPVLEVAMEQPVYFV